MSAGPPTVGVEEEFVLLDPTSGQVALAAPDVIRACHEPDGVVAESMTYMVETRTPICRSLDEVLWSLRTHREQLATQAHGCGAVAVASGVAPFGVPDPPPVTEDQRYAALLARFPFAMRTTGTCACHVHVAVPSRAVGVEVLLRLRPWLPVLAALTSNSPIWWGRDAGWASTRHVFASRWPTAVPPLLVGSEAGYDDAVRAVVAAGEALDSRSVYFLARLSPRYPTVEVRIADVCLSAEEAAAYAVLVRALVAQAMAGPAKQPPAPASQDELTAACRHAAHVGLAGRLTDGAGAWDHVDALVTHVLPFLDRYGDADHVRRTLCLVQSGGGGAERQRRMFEQALTAGEFVAALAAATTGGLR
ncbi:MAG: YbdK family carboxylate-amine ligase [Mycobacteriales bacterium]